MARRWDALSSSLVYGLGVLIINVCIFNIGHIVSAEIALFFKPLVRRIFVWRALMIGSYVLKKQHAYFYLVQLQIR